jgi:hypothetical protein
VPPVTVSVIVPMTGSSSGPNATIPPLTSWLPTTAGPLNVLPPLSVTQSSVVHDVHEPSGLVCDVG